LYCEACGAKIDEGQNFCRGCGKAVGAPAAPSRPPVSRVAAHLRVLAVLWIAGGVLLLVPGFFLLSLSHWRFPAEVPIDVQGFLHPLMSSFAWIMLVGAAACLVAAWGMLERAPWARIFAIVLGAISLVEVPFGTALGIYTLWVLLPESSEAEYREVAAA